MGGGLGPVGDRVAAGQLFEEHGILFDPKLRDEVLRRFEMLDRPAYTGFVMPKLTPVKDGSRKVVDITIPYPLSLESQILEWSGRTR